MPGPPPKRPEERRSRAPSVPMTKLPSEGRKGPAPKPPIPLEPAEMAHWKRLWKKPQAVAWERFGLEDSVARYVIALTKIADGSWSPQVWAECRQMEDRIGLNPLAMLRLRWDVATNELAERRPPGVSSSRPAVVERSADA